MWLIKCSGLRPDVETREARLPLQHTPHQGGLLLQDDLREILPASMISLSLSLYPLHSPFACDSHLQPEYLGAPQISFHLHGLLSNLVAQKLWGFRYHRGVFNLVDMNSGVFNVNVVFPTL